MVRENDHVLTTKAFPEWGINADEIGLVVGFYHNKNRYLIEFESGIVLPLVESEIKVIHGN